MNASDRVGTCGEPGPYDTHCTEQPGHRYSCYDAGNDSSWNDRFPEDWQTDTPHTCEDPACTQARRSSLAGGAGGDHVRSYDPDGKPLRYCATCYQDWPCQPVRDLRTVLADETGEQP